MEDLFGAIGGGICGLLYVALIVVLIAAMWKVFEKAGQPGWTAIVPVLNALVLFRIAGRPWWWLLLALIPIVNVIIAVIVSIDLAKSFGKDTLYGLGLAFLSPIFYPMLGFGDAEYQYEPDPIF